VNRLLDETHTLAQGGRLDLRERRVVHDGLGGDAVPRLLGRDFGVSERERVVDELLESGARENVYRPVRSESPEWLVLGGDLYEV